MRRCNVVLLSSLGAAREQYHQTVAVYKKMNTMVLIRLTKASMIAAPASYALIVTYDNIVDYDSNFRFVAHVMSMDMTLPGKALMQRSSGVFNRAKIWAVIGMTVGLGLWFFVFLVVAGEILRHVAVEALERAAGCVPRGTEILGVLIFVSPREACRA